MTLSPLEFTLRLAVAIVLGTAIGLERQYRQRMAGLRTNVLVATGTCLFVTIAPLVINRQSPVDTEIVSSYEVRAVCRNQDEERVRAAAIAAIEVNGIVLHALSSKDFEDGERVVQRVGGEHGVSAVSWKLVPADADDKTVLAEA